MKPRESCGMLGVRLETQCIPMRSGRLRLMRVIVLPDHRSSDNFGSTYKQSVRSPKQLLIIIISRTETQFSTQSDTCH